jgi:putative thioredoxin
MTTNPVAESTDATFQQDVLERSRERPVIVDFWAPWCGPCRLLGPILEQVASEYGDEVDLVKLNTDENPQVASQYKIEGIPAVIAFRGGAPVSQFVGALPESRVREFFRTLVPTEADRRVAAATQLAAAGKIVEARAAFEAILEEDAGNQGASLGLAMILVGGTDYERAAELISDWPTDPRAVIVSGVIKLKRAAADVDEAAMESRLTADDSDAEAHYRLGCVRAVQQQWDVALDHLLTAIRLDRTLDDDGARLRMLDVFSVLGAENPLTQEYRRRLGSILF